MTGLYCRLLDRTLGEILCMHTDRAIKSRKNAPLNLGISLLVCVPEESG